VLQDVNQTVSQDLELQRRIREGDNAAFSDLYALHKQGVYLFCTRFLGGTQAADDIFQDVFLNLLEIIRGGRDIENVHAYLMRSARNRCLNSIRDRKYPKDIDEMHDYLPGDSDHDNDEREVLQHALQQLPADNREALLLAEYEGYTYDEIAQLTEVPVSTVRKRFFRARQSRREIITPGLTRK
jgi:RNA polymerase sigma-70 factor (ECF subfamily)